MFLGHKKKCLVSVNMDYFSWVGRSVFFVFVFIYFFFFSIKMQVNKFFQPLNVQADGTCLKANTLFTYRSYLTSM